MLLQILACIPVLWILKVLLQKDPEPLNGVYAQPGKWFLLKRTLFYLLFCLRRWRSKKEQLKSNQKDSRQAGYGLKSKPSLQEMECPQRLCNDEHALDAVYFNGMDGKGTYFVFRLGRRHNREAELWLSLKIPGIGFLQTPVHPDTTVYHTDGRSHSAGGLTCQMLEPMRRWRVMFNGLLRRGLHNEWTEDKGETVHVKFSFIWEAYTDVFDFDTDLDPWLTADAIAREQWNKEFWNRLQDRHQTHYEQWGQLRGLLQVQGHEERVLYLRGCRDHSFGVRDWRSFHRYAVHMGVLEDGTAFHVSTLSLPCTTSYLKVGYVSLPNAIMVPVTWSDLELPTLGEHRNPADNYSFNFKAGGRKFHIEVSGHMTPMYYHHRGWSAVVYEKMCNFTINGTKGWGVTESVYRYDGGCPIPDRLREEPMALLTEPDFIAESEKEALTLSFSKPACCSATLVGGKGCQLALLQHMNSQSFIVPKGFCVTIAAFHVQLRENQELRSKVTELEHIACGKEKGSLKQACEETAALFARTPVCGEVQQAVAAELITHFKGDHDNLAFAVRSSAAGEDSAEMSAAGQMETILGVKGMQQIFDAVGKCWSSHFSYQAVEYRRQHGQPIMSSMGVVIQEMVQSQVSGVLFTRDPLTGNPAVMTVNANYGLGESVVSGSSEPDTVTLARSWDNKISISRKVIGSKKIQINTIDEGGVEEQEVSEEESAQCCMTDDVIIRLATIGVLLEKAFAGPRDIEWALNSDNLYLLQARPVTTFGIESEWELMHEFDSPIAGDKEFITTANISEMMPGALTPLSLSTFLRSIEHAMQNMHVNVGVQSSYHGYQKALPLRCGHPFINMHFMENMYEGHVMGFDKQMAELALMGHVLEDLSLEDIQHYNGSSPLLMRVINGIKAFRHQARSYKLTQQWEKKLKTYQLRHTDSAEVLYKAICDHMGDYTQCWVDTSANSSRSGAWGTILMAILSQGKKEWTTQHYSDVAMLLSKCENVYSADVPSALQRLAVIIADCGRAQDFTAMTPQVALQWLQSSESGEAGRKFEEFLKRHGHRCVREADFYEKSWRTEPCKVITVIQAMLQSGRPKLTEHRHNLSTARLIDNIKSPTTLMGRLVLRWALPKAQDAVGHREWGKSISIEMVEAFKQAYWKLAALMVQEGRLPEQELLFFLTHQEIGTLLKERCGALVAKARRRKRIFPKQMPLLYPEISVGEPVPIDESEGVEESYAADLTLTGMPVSQGYAKGTARVVTRVEDAHNIQNGDILIVRYTDVGWTPYFPLISGLVTEIGGLLSHGAVVAREYGLPCIVNVQKATVLFKSGDEVVLNGTEGSLKRLG